MILVDTSIWAEGKSGRRADVAAGLATMLTQKGVFAHEDVHLELLLGEQSKARKQLLSLYGTLPYAEPLTTEAVVQFVIKHGLFATGMGATDVRILAAAHAAGAKIWTFDTKMAAAAKALGCAYEATP
jgi:predicted nucleic acid-binding protein